MATSSGRCAQFVPRVEVSLIFCSVKYVLSERMLKPASKPLHYNQLVEGFQKSAQELGDRGGRGSSRFGDERTNNSKSVYNSRDRLGH